MTVPQDLRYSKEHEWVRLEGDIAAPSTKRRPDDRLGELAFGADLNRCSRRSAT